MSKNENFRTFGKKKRAKREPEYIYFKYLKKKNSRFNFFF